MNINDTCGSYISMNPEGYNTTVRCSPALREVNSNQLELLELVGTVRLLLHLLHIISPDDDLHGLQALICESAVADDDVVSPNDTGARIGGKHHEHVPLGFVFHHPVGGSHYFVPNKAGLPNNLSTLVGGGGHWT